MCKGIQYVAVLLDATTMMVVRCCWRDIEMLPMRMGMGHPKGRRPSRQMSPLLVPALERERFK